MRIFTNRQVADMERRFRLAQQDLKDLRREKNALAAELRSTRARIDRARDSEAAAALYASLALDALGDANRLLGEDE